MQKKKKKSSFLQNVKIAAKLFRCFYFILRLLFVIVYLSFFVDTFYFKTNMNRKEKNEII